ncbi:hypothetical protein ACFL1X_10650 [Candidatus Hydrogenedentota bacterium]
MGRKTWFRSGRFLSAFDTSYSVIKGLGVVPPIVLFKSHVRGQWDLVVFHAGP